MNEKTKNPKTEPKSSHKDRDPNAHFKNAQDEYEKQNYEEAKKHSDSALNYSGDDQNLNLETRLLRGKAHRRLNEYEKACNDFEYILCGHRDVGDRIKAEAFRERGLLYRDLSDFHNLKKNLEMNKEDKLKGLEELYKKLYNETNEEKAEEDLKTFLKAEEDLKEAIESDQDFADAHRSLANLYYERIHDLGKAKKSYNDAKREYKKEEIVNYSVVRWIDARLGEIKMLETDEGVNEKSKKVKEIMTRIYRTEIENRAYKAKKDFRKFLLKKNTLSRSKFVILRRWNSYTPILQTKNSSSEGGGYFFEMSNSNCGVVIDPGFDFISNFFGADKRFRQIDHIIITHAHNDHTDSLESILTLLHKYRDEVIGDFYEPKKHTIMSVIYNEEWKEYDEKITELENAGKKGELEKLFADCEKRFEKLARNRYDKSPRRKRVRIYMSSSTYTKYAPILKLHRKNDYDVIIIKAGDKLPILDPVTGKEYSEDDARDLKIYAIAAKHDDIISDRDSLGFILIVKKFILVYTGDTGYDEGFLKEHLERVCEKEGIDMSKAKIVLLAHFGGFKSYEKRFDVTKDVAENKDFFYKNHLGRLGLAKLVEELKPELCIISEFGEEFKGSRDELARIYNDVYGEHTNFLPADIGLVIDMDAKVEAEVVVEEVVGKKWTKKRFFKHKNVKANESPDGTTITYI